MSAAASKLDLESLCFIFRLVSISIYCLFFDDISAGLMNIKLLEGPSIILHILFEPIIKFHNLHEADELTFKRYTFFMKTSKAS